MLSLLLFAEEAIKVPTPFDPWQSLINLGPMGMTLAAIAYILKPLFLRYMDEMKLNREQNQIIINEFRDFMRETIGSTKVMIQGLVDIKQSALENGRLISTVVTREIVNAALEADRKAREPQ